MTIAHIFLFLSGSSSSLEANTTEAQWDPAGQENPEGWRSVAREGSNFAEIQR